MADKIESQKGSSGTDKDSGTRKMKPHVPPRRKSPILEDAGDPGGPYTPGAKAKRKKKKKKA